MTREDIIENSRFRKAKNFNGNLKVVTLDHHKSIVNKLFDYIEYIESEWFTVKELFNNSEIDNVETLKRKALSLGFSIDSHIYFNTKGNYRSVCEIRSTGTYNPNLNTMLYGASEQEVVKKALKWINTLPTKEDK